MNSIASLARPPVLPLAPARAKPARYFYLTAAAVLTGSLADSLTKP
jgi:hypothetical protein